MFLAAAERLNAKKNEEEAEAKRVEEQKKAQPNPTIEVETLDIDKAQMIELETSEKARAGEVSGSTSLAEAISQKVDENLSKPEKKLL